MDSEMRIERPKFIHVSSLDDVFTDKAKAQKISQANESTIQVNLNEEDSLTLTKINDLLKINGIHILATNPNCDNTKIKIVVTCNSVNQLRDVIDQVHRETNVEISVDENNSSLIDKILDLHLQQNKVWFPRRIEDLDTCGKNVLVYGSELDADHPSFKDENYRKRRKEFDDIALNYTFGNPIPYIKYSREEINTWGTVYKELKEVYKTHACAKHIENIASLEQHCGYSEDNIPQLETVSQYLQKRTGFRLRPVAGFLSPREFLAGLAFRVFNCTQYIRHGKDPFYTPEPDVCHELLGHIGLLADQEFADFSQEIGLASLGVSEEGISKLAACYLYTVEFGLCLENGEIRAYGAGLLSSKAELEHAISSPEKIKEFEPEIACCQEFFVTTFQPVYFLSQTIGVAQAKMRNFVKTLKRPFTVRFNSETNSIEVQNF